MICDDKIWCLLCIISRFHVPFNCFPVCLGSKVALPFDSLQLHLNNCLAHRAACNMNDDWLNGNTYSNSHDVLYWTWHVYILRNYEYYSIFNLNFARRHEYVCIIKVRVECMSVVLHRHWNESRLCVVRAKWWGVFKRLMRADYTFTISMVCYYYSKY